MKKLAVAICWPSASWKTTIAEMLKLRDGYTTPRHFTTRERRALEDNSHYEFVDEMSFIEKIKSWEITIFTTVRGNLYGFCEDVDSETGKLLYVVEPKWIAHLERYCLENQIKLVSILIDINEKERIKRIENREGNLELYHKRFKTDEYLRLAGSKYCDVVIKSTWSPEQVYNKVKRVIENEVGGSRLYKLKKAVSKAKRSLVNILR